MTDFPPLKTQIDLQLTPSTTLISRAPPSLNGYSPAPDRGEEEESSTIKCICGFNDDDGNTVFCEECNTWQHIECYYPRPDGADTSDVPDVHECTDCKPRYLDAASAAERQAQQRLLITAKTKRAPTKGQKRRVKDTLQTNGWRGADGIDRASGSPRDQPPPAKRPKTNHKSSSSNSINQTMSHHRRRTGSAVTGRSPVKRLPSPPYQGPYYSSEFMHLYKGSNFTPVRSNSYASIAVSNDLSSWLTDPDALREVTGKSQHEVFQRWDRPMEELESTSPGVSEAELEDSSIVIDGLHPTFRWVTVNSVANPVAYIGELNGQIGRKEDYFQDPANRWEELRHPEPFVFFHDTLPIYIDCRSEGSSMRYVRRSCDPNVKIQIIIIGTEYHFCLVSTREIGIGEEITLGWTLDKRPHEIGSILAQRSLTDEEEAHMCAWTTKLLANFGGCACGRPQGACAMTRFDRRLHPHAAVQNEKPVKAKRAKKPGHQISPLSTGQATNSRAASEAVNNGDIDDEAVDTRSVSASSRSKPTSRDNTPSVGLGVEMSERDRRKLLQQEKLFEQLEYESQHGGKKKKRNSAGSALNTPSVTTSKQLGFPDGSNPSPTGTHAAIRSRLNGLSHNPQKSIKSRSNCNSNSTQRAKPVYVDASVQTEETDSTPNATVDVMRMRRSRGSFAQRLLRRAEEERRRRAQLAAERKNSQQTSSPLSSKGDPMSAKEAATSMPPPPLPPLSRLSRSLSPRPAPAPKLEEKEDVDMKDVDEQRNEAPTPTANHATNTTPQTSPEAPPSSSSPSHPRPPPPPWPASAVPLPPDDLAPKAATKAPDLHVDLPPPAFTAAQPSTQTPTTPSIIGAPGPFTPGLGSPSPSVMLNAPIFSPSVAANVQSSPAKLIKRTSLGDYMARKKKKDEALAQAQAEKAQSEKVAEAASSSPSQEQKSSTSGPPSLPTALSSTAIEEVDMPLATPRPSSADEKENKPDMATSTAS